MNINVDPISPSGLLNVLTTAFNINAPVLIYGDPGIGKSEIIAQVAKDGGYDLYDIRLLTKDLPDLRGFAVPETATQTMTYYRPDDLPFVGNPGANNKAILFLDEFTACNEMMIAAAYQLLRERRCGSHKLGPNVRIVMAGNIPGRGAIANNIGTAAHDRAIVVVLKSSPAEWVTWALTNQLHPTVIHHIKTRPDQLYPTELADNHSDNAITPTPRSWNEVSKVMFCKAPAETKVSMIDGLVGQAASKEFYFIVNEMSGMPPVDELLKMKPEDAIKLVPAKMTTLFGLAYGCNALANDVKTIVAATELFEEVTKVKGDGLPRAEVQALAMELLFARVLATNSLPAFMKTNAYKVYKTKMPQLVK